MKLIVYVLMDSVGQEFGYNGQEYIVSAPQCLGDSSGGNRMASGDLNKGWQHPDPSLATCLAPWQ